jgi:hypothetical protein
MEAVADQHKPKRTGAYKPGPGRPRGRKNDATIRREAAVKAANDVLGKLLDNAFDGDAHALLCAVYRNPDVPLDLRLDAAKAALRCEKPALRTVAATHTGTLEELVRVSYEVVTGVPRAPNDPPADAPISPSARAPERVEAPTPAMPAPEAASRPAPAATRLAPPLPRGPIGVTVERVGHREAVHDYDPFA